MPEPEGPVPSFILRNKGVPIRLYRMADGQREMSGDDPDAFALTRTVYLRFNANAVADIEEAWDGLRAEVDITEVGPLVVDGTAVPGSQTTKVIGREERVFYGIEGFQKAMEIRQASTVRRAIAIGLGMSPEDVGAAMVDGDLAEYINAVGVAWAMAQGVDPTEAAKMLQKVTAASEEGKKSLVSEFTTLMLDASTPDEAPVEAEVPGTPG